MIIDIGENLQAVLVGALVITVIVSVLKAIFNFITAYWTRRK